MKKTDKNKIDEFIRVDHAGERGAMKIYEGQLLALNTLIKDETLKSLKIIRNTADELYVSYEKNKIKIEEIINFIKTKNVEINDVITYDADLEDVFISLTKN